MENYQFILNSNSLCIFCLCKVEGKISKDDLFPLHHLTSKLGIDLGNVLIMILVPGIPHPDLDRIEVLVEACKDCTDLCEELLYEFQEDVEMENSVKLILDKMEKVRLEEAYKTCWNRLVASSAELVDKLRKELIQKFRLKPELKSNRTRDGSIPNLLDIPGLPFDHICSYLELEEIKDCSTVSKDLHNLVFPSLINSSFITLKNQTQLPGMIDFIKTKSNKFKKKVNLFIKSKSFDGFSDGRSALLRLFQECGSYTSHLKLLYGLSSLNVEVVNGFRDNNSIPVLGRGKELLPSLKTLEVFYREQNYPFSIRNGDLELDAEDLELNYREEQIKASLPFIKAVLENAPILKELKLRTLHHNNNHTVSKIPFLFKLIGESALRIDTLETKGIVIIDEGLGYLQSLNLKQVKLAGYFKLTAPKTLTNFLESQSPSLKLLKLESHSRFFPHFTFPLMESLEAYTASSWDYTKNTENSRPFSFHAQLPKLKELQLRTVIDYYFPLGAKPTTSVKIFRLLSPKYEKDNLIRAVCAFKCLSRLEIPVASYLPDCWKDLKSLEELTLRSIGDPEQENPDQKVTLSDKLSFFDRIITGLPILRRCSNTTEQDIREYEEKYEKMETKKSLALLTKLRLLRLNRRSDYDPAWLLRPSDISCRLVLMKMESLKRVDFWGYSPADLIGISRQVLAEMGEKIDLRISNPDE